MFRWLGFFFRSYTVLKKPLSLKEIKRQVDKKGTVKGIVEVPLDMFFEDDPHEMIIERFNDHVSTALLGNCFLSDICYKMVGCDIKKDVLHFEVSGCADDFLADKEHSMMYEQDARCVKAK